MRRLSATRLLVLQLGAPPCPLQTLTCTGTHLVCTSFAWCARPMHPARACIHSCAPHTDTAAVAVSLAGPALGFASLPPRQSPRARVPRGGVPLGMSGAVRVITFDIDGTICVSDKLTEGVVANAMHRGAFAHAFQAVCGFEGASIDEVCHARDARAVRRLRACTPTLAQRESDDASRA